MTYPTPIDGRCTACGSESMTLAEDQTVYSPCEFDGTWTRRFSDVQASEMDDAVRFFCADCGEPHAVPEELK